MAGRWDAEGGAPNREGTLFALPSLHEVTIVDLGQGRVVRTIHLAGLAPLGSAVRWLGDGRTFAVVDEESRISILDASTGLVVNSRVVPGLAEMNSSRPGDATDRVLATFEDGPRFRLLDLATLEDAPLPIKAGPHALGIQFAANESRCVWADRDSEGEWSVIAAGRVVGTVKVPGTIWSATPSSDGHEVFVALADGVVACYDVESGRLKWQKPILKGEVAVIQTTKDGHWLVATSDEREGVVVNLASADHPVAQQFDEGDWPAVLANGTGFMTSGPFGLRAYPFPPAPSKTEFAVSAVGAGWFYAQYSSFSPDGRLLTSDRNVLVEMDPRSGTWRNVAALKSKSRIDMENHLRNLRIREDRVEILDPEGKRPVRKAEAEGGSLGVDPLAICAVDPQARWAAVPTSRRTVALVDLGSGQTVRELATPNLGQGVVFSPDGTRLISATNGWVGCWSVPEGRLLWQDKDTATRPQKITTSPDGGSVGIAGYEGRVRIYDVQTGRFRFDLVGHGLAVYALNWSPDGKRIVTGSGDKTVRIWDAATGRELEIVGSHATDVVAVRFLPGGRTLASFSGDGVLKLWRLEDQL